MPFYRSVFAVPLFLFLAILGPGCSDALKSGSAGPQPPPPTDNKKPPDENPLPARPLPEIAVTEEGYLSLSKDGLEREFLLQANFIDHSNGKVLGSPSFEGIMSRIVYFLKKNKSLFMMESTVGYLAGEEIPSEKILTEFEIIQEGETEIVFDFNEGMKRIFIMGDWYVSDFWNFLPPQYAVKTDHSFIKEVSKSEKRILIRQMAQLDIEPFLFPVEVVYYLEPYRANDGFEPILNPGFERVGYFEANPLVREGFGTLETHITRWDIRKPIVFHIFADTPKEYVEAVREGVLYWNKAFGAKIVDVQTAPEGVFAPNPDYNVIQWITNHQAGFAYADAQMDPRTGEILHAQVFFTTTFTERALDKLTRTQKVEEEKDPKPLLTFGLNGFSSGLMCNHPLPLVPADFIAPQTQGKERALQLTEDYVREVIAHEVGHVLGLRHNFAASTSSHLTPSEVSSSFDTYLKEGEVSLKGQIASSVMDYLPFEEAILNGKYIGETESSPLTYDAMAIRWGYYGQGLERNLASTLFCTDSQLWRYADCALFDGSIHPILVKGEGFNKNIRKGASQIAAIYLAAKTYFDEKGRLPVEKVALNAGGYAKFLTSPLRDLISLLKGEVSSLYVERNFNGVITDFNQEKVYQATTDWIDKAVALGGGVQNLLSLLGEKQVYDRVHRYENEFNTIIRNPSFAENFTEKELTLMEATARAFFEVVGENVIREITEILADPEKSSMSKEPSSYRPIADLEGLEETLAGWAEFIINDNAQTIPTFQGEHRLTATLILQSGQGPTKKWQETNRKKILNNLLEKLQTRYGVPLDKVNPALLSKEEKEIYEWEKAIIEALSGERKPS